MKKNKFQLIMVIIMMFVLSCTSQKKASEEDDFSTGASSSDTISENSSENSSDLEGDLDLDSASNGGAADNLASATGDEFSEFNDAPNAPVTKTSDEDDLEKELNQLDGAASSSVATVTPSQIPVEPPPVVEQSPASPAIDSIPAPEIVQNPAEPAPSVLEPAIEAPAVFSSQPAEVAPSKNEISQINSVQYQSNQSGGTIVINSSQPLQFTTRLNSATNQLVVEVQNSTVPKKLKRTLNTKDMASSIGSVDIYQKPNSKVSRFVVQLRPGSSEPLVQPEGNSLLIVGAPNQAYAKSNNPSQPQSEGNANSGETLAGNNNSGGSGSTNEHSPQANTSAAGQNFNQPSEVNPDLTSEGIMSSQNLEDFLASNNKFYGKKISIETPKLDINDAFRFLAEESNVNMIIDEGIKGEVTLKLRQVPWDQAFVLLLKSKKLGYKRQGSVIRIASIETLLKEEDEAIKLAEARRGNESLAVKRFFIGYADIADLEKKIKDFVSPTVLTATGQASVAPSRGKVISDSRTSSLIVTETPTNIAKIEKLIAALDTQPKQVLIEGKVVEASEKFVRGMGVNWNSPATGSDAAPGANLIRPALSFTPGLASAIFNPTFGLGASGRPGDLGNLTATLSLGEKEDKVRILSSPRISVLSNQPAVISQTVNVSIEKVTNVGTQGTTISTEQVPVGVSLKVTPQVSNEGTVVMDLDIERSFPGTANTSNIEKRNAKTKVIVRSGQTAVIGGIFQADAQDSASGIPFLKNIPVFGLLFKGSQTIKSKNELVIFITPRIQKAIQGEPATTTTVE